MGVFDKLKKAVSIKDDDYDDDEFYDDEDLDEEDDDYDEDEEPKKKGNFFTNLFSRRKKNDDLDDEDFDEEDDDVEPASSVPAARPAAARPAAVTPPRRRGRNVEINVNRPSNMEDCRDIADTLLAGSMVVLNLEGMDVEVAQRVVDFSSGACYSIGGTLQKVSSYIFILTPANVDVSGDVAQVINGTAVPSIRTNL
ncbi:MAG: cell division protein SepF [Eubacterium sp.]|nr:cell division protein SepF [Eubacterium sp.]